MEKREVSVEYIVEVDLWVVPSVVFEIFERLTLVAPRDDAVVHGDAVAVNAVFEPTAEQIDAHDTEDEPEDQTDKQHVEDGRDCLDQRIHNHL